MSVDGFRVVDVDSHVYEPPELWERFVPAEYRGVARAAFLHDVDEHGNAIAQLNGEPTAPMNESPVVRHAVWSPGTEPDDIGRLDLTQPPPRNPGAHDGAARLQDMDTLGIDAAVLHPTLFNEYLPLVRNVDAASVLARAYNDWVWDMTRIAPDRLHPVAVLPLQNVVLARRELARVVEIGFRGVNLRPMFYEVPSHGASTNPMQALMGAGARSFVDDPRFRQVWADIEAADLVACVHPSPGSTNPDGTSTGTFIERVARSLRIGHRVAETVAGVQDLAVFVVAACFHGLLEEFPSLKLALLHGSASMTPLTLEKAETYLWLGSGSGAVGQTPVSLEPEDVWLEHRTLASFPSWERSVGRLAEKMPAVGDKAAWGSRYPHHDAGSPAEAIANLRAENLADARIQALMADHAADLFGLRVPVPG